MKKKSEKTFSTVLWRCVLVAIVLTLTCVLLKCAQNSREKGCDYSECYHSEYLSPNIYYHNTEDGKGFVYNSLTGEKTIWNVKWIARPDDDDSLICFNNGKKRGYFNKYTGKVVIEPKYGHAWTFSEGLASVEEDGYIKFINGTGKVVIDKKIPYIPNMDAYMFHGGYCVVESENNGLLGLMDKTGKMVLPTAYSMIERESSYDMWRVRKGEEMALLDKELKPVIPFMKGSIYVGEGTIDMTMADDHTMRKYDLNGQLINDFYVTGVQILEYEKDEILYRTKTLDEDGSEYAVPFVESYHPSATARLRVYTAGDDYQGLMTAEGHVVTMPLYKNISAIGYDLYLCEVSNGDKVVVNGKGEMTYTK